MVRVGSGEEAVGLPFEFLIEVLVDYPITSLVSIAIAICVDYFVLQVLDLQIDLLQQPKLLFVVIYIECFLAALGAPSHVGVLVELVLVEESVVFRD